MEEKNPALAQMMHQSDLFGWLVRTIGRALGVLIGTPIAGYVLAFATGEYIWIALGSVVGLGAFIWLLAGARAPSPERYVMEVLEDGLQDS